MKSKKELRVVPAKNYVILAIIAIITILLTFYINAWIKTYKDNAYSTSALSGNVKEVNINELREPFYEINEVVLYVGFTNEENLYVEEKKLLKVIRKYDLTDSVMYLNVTDIDDYSKTLEKRFGNDNVAFGNAPLLIYISSGETKEVVKITNYSNLSKAFEKLVRRYDIGENY